MEIVVVVSTRRVIKIKTKRRRIWISVPPPKKTKRNRNFLVLTGRSLFAGVATWPARANQFNLYVHPYGEFKCDDKTLRWSLLTSMCRDLF